jgi:hypothetical protein
MTIILYEGNAGDLYLYRVTDGQGYSNVEALPAGQALADMEAMAAGQDRGWNLTPIGEEDTAGFESGPDTPREVARYEGGKLTIGKGLGNAATRYLGRR